MVEEINGATVLIDRPLEHVMQVTLNRPEARNAVNGALARSIAAAASLSEKDNDIRVFILAAIGDKCFCAGADLSELAAGRAAELQFLDEIPIP